MMARGENFLISDRYWNSHDYHLHDSDIAEYKMKLYKDTRSENKKPTETLTLRENKQTSFPKSYRTILNAHTELMSNSVQYAHLVG